MLILEMDPFIITKNNRKELLDFLYAKQRLLYITIVWFRGFYLFAFQRRSNSPEVAWLINYRAFETMQCIVWVYALNKSPYKFLYFFCWVAQIYHSSSTQNFQMASYFTRPFKICSVHFNQHVWFHLLLFYC